MFHASFTGTTGNYRAPRRRGGVPLAPVTFASVFSCSPPMWGAPLPSGWPERRRPSSPPTSPGVRIVLPAGAGMVPLSTERQRSSPSDPRTRGDGPETLLCPGQVEALLPAPAGMVQRPAAGYGGGPAVPRTRGDGPSVTPRPASMSSCSPHPRGWPLRPGQPAGDVPLLPAPAGMVPAPAPRRSARRTAPRARGDGPTGTSAGAMAPICSSHRRGWSPPRDPGHGRHPLLPAPAGMVPKPAQGGSGFCTAPRTRRGGPYSELRAETAVSCSPHPRGWSPDRWVSGLPVGLLPAPPAGMVPARLSSAGTNRAAPCARGDGPSVCAGGCGRYELLPRPRGWSRWPARSMPVSSLLPAPAGMVPALPGRAERGPSAPRARGDGPVSTLSTAALIACSPHSRGWSPENDGVPRDERLVPAPAGMAPKAAKAPPSTSTAPCTRGDGPCEFTYNTLCRYCSPQLRGWSRPEQRQLLGVDLLPASAELVSGRERQQRPDGPAPRTRGDGPAIKPAFNAIAACSPRPRGWSHQHAPGDRQLRLLRAPAGMVPPRCGAAGPPAPAPRTRGDGLSRVPGEWVARICSPHPRGWSLEQARKKATTALLPVPAGMVPSAGSQTCPTSTALRTRGDGPDPAGQSGGNTGCSPHPRGWSRRDLTLDRWRKLLPVPAGMVPVEKVQEMFGNAAPRTRGDGPCIPVVLKVAPNCSPHPRGWSRARLHWNMAGYCSPRPQGWSHQGAGRKGRPGLLPAPAGMVPRPWVMSTASSPAPRIRGDGPWWRCSPRSAPACSPHPRGWSRSVGVYGTLCKSPWG
ncbi:hypothetical protein BJY27_006921 [Streptomyces rapamycinicus]|uniref:Uncharacterized protein n=2 Tax=Streptomyces rapamycinicus TaxID=1226757 RepID=A0ABR6LUE7_9ACTN|nr:hypothetical protein [Streptomyces rapamycinicus]RLV78579.1 putative secreted protein [Streptomyces rapamycinicus NRRL 5491]